MAPPSSSLAWEITENLHRLDLTAAERKKQVKLLADVFGRMDTPLVAHHAPPTNTRKDGRKKGGQHQKGVASKVAEATGMSKRRPGSPAIWNLALRSGGAFPASTAWMTPSGRT